MTTASKTLFYLRPAVLFAICLAMVLFGIAVAKEFELIDGGLAKRAAGITIGVVLLVTGNILPKIVQPLAVTGLDSAGRAERFAGWIFVLTGLIYVAVWMLVPLEHAMTVSSLIGLAGFSTVTVVWLWLSRPGSQRRHGEVMLGDQATQMFEQSFASRGVIFLILHAICWVFAMFLADAIWGDRVAQWMAVIFAIVNGGLCLLLTAAAFKSRISE